MTSAETIIQVENVSFSYPEQEEKAVDGVSMAVRQASSWRCWATTAAARAPWPSCSTPCFCPPAARCGWGHPHQPAGQEWEVRRQCGMVFQNPDNQLVATIVEEDVAFGLENLGVETQEIRRRVDEALTMVGMSKYALSAPHMLSGGQKQRIAIAGVLAMRPRVIVFDEATAMLDPVGRLSVMEVVKRLNREEGITVVWITHFMEEAAQADRLLVMDAGRIQMEGTPRQVSPRGTRCAPWAWTCPR